MKSKAENADRKIKVETRKETNLKREAAATISINEATNESAQPAAVPTYANLNSNP